VLLVAVSYILPVAAMALTRLSPSAWDTGSWADIAYLVGGPLLRIGLVLGGMMSAFGMFNGLVMSYSRLPYAMAQDGMLPPIFARVTPRAKAPWVSIIVLSTGWALCLGLGFERLVMLDIMIYGASLALEFVALVVLRFTEPDLPRPFKVPGGIFGAVLAGAIPMLLVAFAVLRSDREQILGMNSFLFGALTILAGFAAYAIDTMFAKRARASKSGSNGIHYR
jgi:amino acid transporter